MNINIPTPFIDILSKDQKLHGIINSTLSDFGEILEDNSLFFFPEYTDHGLKHIEAVLESSANLMTKETIENVVEPKDIAIYILAVILHDLGMHLSLDGFIHLISNKYDQIVEPKFDKISWVSLWENYMNEAKRFNSKQLTAIFGDESVIIKIPNLENRGEISQNDRILIGEFIRRHHPRIAHEIALKGFPAVDNNVLPFGNNLDTNLLDLAGLIARSHGLSLRRPLELIEERHPNAKRTPFNIHAVFLMTVLRLSDYLQIDRTRTSKIVLKTKSLQSPISIREHNTHLSIKYIDDKNQDDPERIYVHTSPESSKIFVKLEALIQDIQSEFDISWAVLGELYGRFNSNKPLLKYRRIISNLNEATLQKSLQYVPQKVSFKANEELLLILIAPLYGDNPIYGVRELVQNSVDACMEREHLNKQKADYKGQVNIYLKKTEKEFFFEINDNGKGMNAEEIKTFFLTAGSSYRKSPNWQFDYMNEDGDSLVRRSGKFGIGVLAAFLLGNQITVCTKRCDEEIGIRFTAKIIDEQIELELDSTISIGTKILIKISERTYNSLSKNKHTFNWFWLEKPQVKYWVGDKEMNPYNMRKILPGEYSPLSKKTHEIKYDGYNRILWSYDNGPKLLCNGIKIRISELEPTKKTVVSKLPKLSIFDYNGILPYL